MLNFGTKDNGTILPPEFYVHEVKNECEILCQPCGRWDIDTAIWGINSSILRYYNFKLNFRISNKYKSDIEKEISDLSAPVRLS